MKNETVLLRDLMNFKIGLMESKSTIECERADMLIRLLDNPNISINDRQKTMENIRTQAKICSEYSYIIDEFNTLLFDIEESLADE